MAKSGMLDARSVMANVGGLPVRPSSRRPTSSRPTNRSTCRSVSDEIVLTENVPVARNRGVWHATFRRDPQTIHLPGVDLPAVVTPENVALAVIVVVADVLDVPVVGDRSMRDRAFGFDVQAIHLPDVDLPAVVAPENVALTITVEVADALDMPV